MYCLQNHDQVGNRALGDRLTCQVEAEAFASATMLFLFLPATPLLFMGQEWGSTTPFRYFTGHEPALGRLVTEGRRREFAGFSIFVGEGARSRIPDPQAPSTFEGSRLDWTERNTPRARRLLVHLGREPVVPPHDAGTASGPRVLLASGDELAPDRPMRPGSALLLAYERSTADQDLGRVR